MTITTSSMASATVSGIFRQADGQWFWSVSFLAHPPHHGISPTLDAARAAFKTEHIDTSTAAGKCFLDMLGVFAEFETNLRRERQLEGIAKAKAAGVYKGRPASIDAVRVRVEGARPGADRDCKGSQDRAGVGLPSA